MANNSTPIGLLFDIGNNKYGPITVDIILSTAIGYFLMSNKLTVGNENGSENWLRISGILIICITIVSLLLIIKENIVDKSQNPKDENGYKLSLVPFIGVCLIIIVLVIAAIFQSSKSNVFRRY